MGSDYQFPQSNVREPSFSLYLNGDDRCRMVKLAELTRSRSGQNGRLSIDGEISVFSADKYFNERTEDGSQKQKPEESGSFFTPRRSKVSLGTPSIRSESSWNSQSGLLQRFPTQVPERRKKSLLSSFSCRCSCANNKSLEVDDQHHKRSIIRAGMNRADRLLHVSATLSQKPWMTAQPCAKPSLLEKASASPVAENPSQKLQRSVTRKSMRHERILNLLHWDDSKTRSEDVYIPSAISVEYYTDGESDASSDLFEIDSFTGNRNPSGNATPTTCYAPSEASIEWSVIKTPKQNSGL